MTGGAASSSLPGPTGVSAVVPVQPLRTETSRDAVATAGWLARHSVDCLSCEDPQRSAECNVEDVIATDGASPSLLVTPRGWPPSMRFRRSSFSPVTQCHVLPNASARIMIPLARGPSGLAGRRRRRRQW